MAGKSALPLALAAGGAALLLMSGKKKKKKTSSTPKDDAPPIDVSTLGTWTEDKIDPAKARVILDEECMEIAQKANATAWNTMVTNRFHQLLKEGWDDMSQITIQILHDNSHHCPWKGDPANWTPMMKEMYDQLHEAVKEYYRIFTGGPAPGDVPPPATDEAPMTGE